MMPIIGDNIKTARISRNLSQRDLAKLIGSTQPQVARWESAKSLSTANLATIACALGLTLDNLITGVWPAAQACARCGLLLVPGNILQLGMHPEAPFFCLNCVKWHTRDCLNIKERIVSEAITAGAIRQSCDEQPEKGSDQNA